MRIIIEYEASWRNSFLDGSNDEPLPRKGRNFIGSMTELKRPENFLPREVSKNTVLGILSRLIGDQRKLYQARQSQDYYFADLEDFIDFKDNPNIINHEIAYIRNMKGSTDQNAFTGMIKVNDPIFLSDYSYEFWNVLSLNIDELCDFIINDKAITDFKIDNPISLDPIAILNRLETIGKSKPVDCIDVIKRASDKLASLFDKYKPLNTKGLQLILPMYCSALYLQMQRLAKRFDMTTAKSRMGGISGISNNGFTPKDFMDKYTTGAKKIIYGNPYVREEFIKGEGKINHTLKKVSGQLEIILNIEPQKAIELKQMIDNAGVSSFYLGKKGLAYVTDIREK
ncbi:type I-Fv CRISPR-associated protein Cas5fv [Moraxella haemolytica]|uniref:type I-Fv CRISPR-associated protein Cas5fv n=1 Tax=Moraxella haemolytica TaxID=2904119 RepID=UPI00254331D0|nr:type I-Fv CRISPR-associated protein Cas5fv [Moraxella sp. ZY171148]WII95305.1 type I-Fv CRISPR-associated protein Cas5fv [Moraxella sp. ZY171148]